MMKKLFQTKCPAWIGIILVYTVTLSAGCKQHGYDTPEGYDTNKPIKMELGKVLNEISGLSYNKDDSSLLAISDSKEKIFSIRLKNKKLKDFTDKVVGPDSDLEDLVYSDSMVYLLSSPGVIKAVPPGAKDSSGVRTYELNLPGQNDFESLYYDASVKGLIAVCKSCASDKGLHQRSAYRFDLETKSFDSAALFTFNTSTVDEQLKDKDAKFDPSGIAVNPINKRLYVLSSSGNLLIVADNRGKIIETHKLNPDDYPQAEGIAFAPNGDMYISNEGKYGKPTLLHIPYRQAGKKNK
ncbi:MAG TPA: SdiA-regulated domain-containing protein [Flavisolibacter sp.]|jgi:uncharacterized protein YjiK|nr:SdiA-regulated domain-containing protein [Flavisolibacter sp.]